MGLFFLLVMIRVCGAVWAQIMISNAGCWKNARIDKKKERTVGCFLIDFVFNLKGLLTSDAYMERALVINNFTPEILRKTYLKACHNNN